MSAELIQYVVDIESGRRAEVLMCEVESEGRGEPSGHDTQLDLAKECSDDVCGAEGQLIKIRLFRVFIRLDQMWTPGGCSGRVF